MDKFTYTIEVVKDSPGASRPWAARMKDQDNRVIAHGYGKTGPLDAASNAAINASNAEYDALREAGT